MGDVICVKQIFINLFSNVVKYNVEGGYIIICSCWVGVGIVEIVIEDGGMGLNFEQLVYFFQFFNWFGCEYGDIIGIGIGLVIVKWFVELMGGSFGVISIVGKGFIFMLSLLVGDVGLGSFWVGVVEILFEKMMYIFQFGGCWCIVYIEDNVMNVELMCGVLEQWLQVELQVFEMGWVGLEVVLVELLDLLLLDMQLFDIDGFEVLCQLCVCWLVQVLLVVVVLVNVVQVQIDVSVVVGVQYYFIKLLDVCVFLSLLDCLLVSVGEV